MDDDAAIPALSTISFAASRWSLCPTVFRAQQEGVGFSLVVRDLVSSASIAGNSCSGNGRACERANSPVQYLLIDTSSLAPFTRVKFPLAARTLLESIIGGDDALIFTTYSLRRAMLT